MRAVSRAEVGKHTLGLPHGSPRGGSMRHNRIALWTRRRPPLGGRPRAHRQRGCRQQMGSDSACTGWRGEEEEEEEEEEEVGGMQHSADTDTRRLARPTWPGQRRPPPGAWEEAAGHGPGRQAAAPLSARRPRPPRCLGAAGRWDRG
ncbi:unnamed protein product [Prorocentrum cordatum]|uniref:Uncharacterized protein n=1 Tax=Prorocentrum cordatum TaxID=2364126 RepID=A0ABN9Y5F9_9DINO|nr:unnamed protein product [Polarella glacialis]